MDRPRATPTNDELRQNVVRPDKATAVTYYFLERWLPILGPDAAATLLWMRAAQSALREAGQLAELKVPAQVQLAGKVGLRGEKSLRRALRTLERFGFICSGTRYVRDEGARRTIRRPNRYIVAMEDPITPQDEGRIAQVAAERVGLSSPQLRWCNGPEGALSEGCVQLPDGLTATTAAKCNRPAGGRPPEDPYFQAIAAARAATNVRSKTSNVDVSGADRGKATRLAAELCEALQDPGSRRFFYRVALQLPEDTVRAVLSETLQARREGRIRTNAGAYFTDQIKRAAAEMGCPLKARPSTNRGPNG